MNTVRQVDFFVGPSSLSELVVVLDNEHIKLDVSAPKNERKSKQKTTVFVALEGQVVDLELKPIDNALIFVQGAEQGNPNGCPRAIFHSSSCRAVPACVDQRRLFRPQVTA